MKQEAQQKWDTEPSWKLFANEILTNNEICRNTDFTKKYCIFDNGRVQKKLAIASTLASLVQCKSFRMHNFRGLFYLKQSSSKLLSYIKTFEHPSGDTMSEKFQGL